MIVVQQAMEEATAEHSIPPASLTSKPIETDNLVSRGCRPDGSGDVVVCGRTDSEQFRLRPLRPPPQAANFLQKPLRVQIAPGVTFGLQQGGGIGLKAKFGPGRKSGETDPN